MATQKQLRWGILGVAKINDRLLPAFAAAKLGTLQAIASRSLPKAQEAAKAAQIPQAFGSYEELLASSNVDAVYIPLPNHLHDEWTRKAADAGKHILCEKPLTPEAASARALVEYVRTRGVKMMDGFMWPHHPRTAVLRQLLDANTIGRVERVDASFTFQLPLDPQNIRLQPAASGGSLLDVGCYPVFGIRWAFGEEPARVFATARYAYGVDVTLSALLWFADGRTASFDCGFTLPLRQTMQITGSKGVITIPNMWVPEPDAAFNIQMGDATPERRTCHCPSQIVCMLDDFAAAVQAGTDPAPAIDDAVKSLRVLDAIAKSARENRVVEC